MGAYTVYLFVRTNADREPAAVTERRLQALQALRDELVRVGVRVTPLPGHGNLRVLVIHPSGFPAGAGLAIAAGYPGQSPRGGDVELTIGPPVKASPQCTGS